MKKSVVTRELANVFPDWTKIRTSDQSLGYQLLNALAQPLERMEKELVRSQANYYLVTANLDEIDILYKVKLPAAFSFDENTDDPTEPIPLAPTVSGVVNSVTYEVTAVEDNHLESFWYDALPDRYSIGETVTGVNHELVSVTVSDLPDTNTYEHHLSGGTVWVEAVGGTEYLTFEGKKLNRGRVILKGKTRKGTYESETIIFPWDMKQKSMKEWEKIYDIDTYDIEPDVLLEIRSADFNQGPYLSVWNTRFSDQRKKIDEFWDLGTVTGVATLDRVEYVSDEWQQLVLGFSDKNTVESWELVDDSLNNISGVDVALQPFQDRAWVVTSDAQLYCYDIAEEMVSGIDLIKDKTAGAEAQIEVESHHVVRGEDIVFTPLHVRPLQEIRKYRIWYQTPSGNQYGIKDKAAVAITDDFWVPGDGSVHRNIESAIYITAEELGEYLLVLETEMWDGTVHIDKVLVMVNFKQPIKHLDLSSDLTEDCVGIDFDSDQQMWIQTVSGYHRVDFHYDIMLIDYINKVLYFREEYDEVEVF